MNISYSDATHILALENLSLAQKAVLFALLSHMHPGTKLILPSYETLGKELGCSSRTVKRAIDDLVAQGHLEVRKELRQGRQHNFYIVPFSNGYQYHSEQNDESIPDSLTIPSKERPERQGAKKSAAKLTYQQACENIVYQTPIPSVFVDVMFKELELQDYRDAYENVITPRGLRGHIVRMWASAYNKPFFHALEKAWDEYWEHLNTGDYNNPDCSLNRQMADDAIQQLYAKYGVNWNQPWDKNNKMSPPMMGVEHLSFTYYPDKQAIRAKNLPSNP